MTDDRAKGGRHATGDHHGFSVERFARSFVGRPRPMHILMLVMCLVLGVAITTTVRAQASDPLAGLNEDQLVAILGDLDQREQALIAERSQLETQLADLNEAVDAQEVAREAVEKATVQAQVAAGTVPVVGPGVVMRISDVTTPLPVSVFVTTLAELRNAGAESISINGIRLNVRSWFGTDDGGNIVASGVALQPPYEWRAIGDANTLAMAMEIRGGAASQFRAYGAQVNVEGQETVAIDAVASPFSPQWAAPATE